MTTISAPDSSIEINGSLTVIGTVLELRLQNASVSVSGDLRLQDGISWLVGNACVVEIINSLMLQFFCIAILNLSLTSSSSTVVVAGDFILDQDSVMSVTISSPDPSSFVAAPVSIGRSSAILG